jgi:hypothetical protein
MNFIKYLHFLSHLKWLFGAWMIGLMLYFYICHPSSQIYWVGKMLFAGGLMMNFMSFTDNTKLTPKTIKTLSDPEKSKRTLLFLSVSAGLVLLCGLLFLSTKYIFPQGEQSIVTDLTNLGYDSLVFFVGFLALIKQHIETIEYVKTLNN